jgi:hypothetical protein
VLANQRVERGDFDVHAAVPVDAGELRIGGAPVTPSRRQARHRWRPLADRQRSTTRLAAGAGLDDADAWAAREQPPQQARKIRLRLERDDAAAERREAADVITGVGADVEHEIAGLHELSVEVFQPPLPQRDRVIDRQRAKKAEGAVDPAHRNWCDML